MTREIELTQGKVAIVDDAYYDALAAFGWYARKDRNTFYAERHTGRRPHRKMVLMHRTVLNAPDGVEVDHIDGNGLNNTRANLRLATTAENQRNRGRQTNNKSGHKGVSWEDARQRWRAQIKLNGQNIHLGYFDDPLAAARAYDEAARKYHGEFANFNFQV